MIDKLENGNYQISDMTTDSSQRFETHYYFRTTWNKKLELLKFEFGFEKPQYREEELDKLDRRDKLAKNRHLKELKIYLGLLKEKIPQEVKLIIKPHGWDFFIIDMFEIKDKILRREDEIFRKNNCNWVRWTKEKEMLINEYKEKEDEFEDYKDEINKKIFEKVKE